MLLAVYGSLRKGQQIGAYLNELRDLGDSETLVVSGLKIYVVGEVPGAKVTLNEEDKAVIELISADVVKETEEAYLELLDAIEGVEVGLYRRNIIETPKGSAVIYTICEDVSHCKSIKDWVEWQKKSKKEKEIALKMAGNSRVSLL